MNNVFFFIIVNYNLFLMGKAFWWMSGETIYKIIKASSKLEILKIWINSLASPIKASSI